MTQKRNFYLNIILFIKLALFSIKSIAEDDVYLFSSYGSSSVDAMDFDDSSVYKNLKTSALWTDSYGNYGTEECVGNTQTFNNKINLIVFCKLTDQENKDFRVSRHRSSLEGGGGGFSVFIDGDKKYKFLLDKKCNYGVKYIKNNFWFTQKCKI